MTERKALDEQLEELRGDVIKLAAMVGESIGAGTRAVLDADLGLAEQVIAGDEAVDELNRAIELRSYELFALQQPLMAVDLRTLLATLRILAELELTANLMVSVAKASRRLYPTELPPKIRGLIERMGAQGSVQLNLAVDAFADLEPSLASALADLDDVMDDLQKELFRAIFETCSNDEAGLQQAVQLALLGRFYERIADHAVQIGRWVTFMVTGEFPFSSAAPGQDRVGPEFEL